MKKLWTKTQGFTLVELMVALGIAAVIGVAAFSMIENFNRSKETAAAKGDQSDIRNLVFSALKLPAACPQNIVGAGLYGIHTPGTSVPISIVNAAGGNVPILQDSTYYGNVFYNVSLSGVISHSIPGSDFYHAKVLISVDRTKIGLGRIAGNQGKGQLGSATVSVSVPLTIQMSPTAGGTILSCSADQEDNEIIGGIHTAADCTAVGGTPAAVNGLGRLCLFNPYNFTLTNSDQATCFALGCTWVSTNLCSCNPAVGGAMPSCPPGPPAGTAAAYGVAPSQTWDCQYASPPTSGCPAPWYVPAPNPAPGPYSWCELTANQSSCTAQGGIFSAGPPPTCTQAVGCPSGATDAGPNGSGGRLCTVSAGALPAGAAMSCPTGWTSVVTYLSTPGQVFTCE